MRENRKKILPYIVFVFIAEAVGVLSGLITRSGIEAYGALDKPGITPPAIVFPIVWTVLYALMGIGAARLWSAPTSVSKILGLRLFAYQLVVNFFWGIFFFNRQAFWFAFAWLILLLVLVVLMTAAFYRTDKSAAYLQIPYILWLLFAGFLNALVAVMNR